jgi:uncharacterized membrane protein YoaK (UPF0700 family)
MNTIAERRIHMNMALIGGFLGGFAVINHNDLLASAQTSNLIALALALAGRTSAEVLTRVGALLVYALAFCLTIWVPRKLKWNNQLVSIAIDILALLTLALLPKDLDAFVAMYPIFFAAAYQWCSFPTSEGYTSSTIFSTNNVRQFVTALAAYAVDQDPKMLGKARVFGKVLLAFHVGVAFAWFSCQSFGAHGAFLALVPCLTALTQELAVLDVLPFPAKVTSNVG